MNILVVNFGGIGDEILFLPTLRSLKEKYPNSNITLALEPRSSTIKNLTNDIDNIIKCDIKAAGFKKYINVARFLFEVWVKRFDILIISGSSPMVSILAYLTGIKKRIGYKTSTSFLLTNEILLNKNQYAGSMYHDLVKELTSKEYKNPQIVLQDKFTMPFEGEFVLIHPGVSKMSLVKNIIKCPNVDFWKNLISGILEKGKKVVLVGGPDDKDIIEKLSSVQHINFFNLYGKTRNLQELASIIDQSSAFICVDSAPMHIGVALNKNIYAIFAPTDPNKLIPNLPNIKLIKNDSCTCSPCLWDKRAESCENHICTNINPLNILNIL